jgi:polyisoprenoid-binding protein YceI
MKYIITIVAVLILGYFVWGAIQTKPDPAVPQARVTETPATTDQPKTQTSTPTPKDVQPTTHYSTVDNSQVKVAFKGFGPGKVHDGSFATVDSKLMLSVEGEVLGTVAIDLKSMQTEIEKLTTHLQSKDFFDTANYPKATFVIKEQTDLKNIGLQITGDMTIKGVTKSITFPVKYEVMKGGPNVRLAYPARYTADFTLDLKNFGIDQTFANSTVQVILTVPVK